MAITDTAQAKLLFEKMRHTQAKQEITAGNLARSGVAGEKSKEIEPFNKVLRRQAPSTSGIKTTNPNHLTGSIKNVGFKVKNSRDKTDASLTGNTISPEEQLLQLNEASTDFYRLEQVKKNEKSRILEIMKLGSGK